MRKLRWNEICRTGEALHLARVSAPQPVNWQLHVHDFYECFFIEEGRGWHLLEADRQTLEAGHLVFLRPEHAHGFQSPSGAALTLTNLAFSSALVQTLRPALEETLAAVGIWQKTAQPVTFRLNHAQQGQLLALLETVAAGGRETTDAAYFLTGALRLLRYRPGMAHASNLPAWMHDALAACAEPENLREGLSRLLQLCGRTTEHVARSFRQHLGLTPTQWITQSRVRLACRLLETTAFSITEVAGECGFENLSHFHRCFKAQTAQTPLAYRKRAREAMGMQA